jgi:hypothetical protein
MADLRTFTQQSLYAAGSSSASEAGYELERGISSNEYFGSG